MIKRIEDMTTYFDWVIMANGLEFIPVKRCSCNNVFVFSVFCKRLDADKLKYDDKNNVILVECPYCRNNNMYDLNVGHEQVFKLEKIRKAWFKEVET